MSVSTRPFFQSCPCPRSLRSDNVRQALTPDGHMGFFWYAESLANGGEDGKNEGLLNSSLFLLVTMHGDIESALSLTPRRARPPQIRAPWPLSGALKDSFPMKPMSFCDRGESGLSSECSQSLLRHLHLHGRCTSLQKEADRRGPLGGHCLFSVWRPINHPVEDMPLAVCDGSTVQPSDLVETDHVRTSYIGSTMYLMSRPEHRWHYVSRQRPDEVLLFKNFDSASDVAAKCK